MTQFRSKLEEDYARRLTSLELCWEYEPLWLRRSGVSYQPDFAVWKDGAARGVCLEAKGDMQPQDAKKCLSYAEFLEADDWVGAYIIGFQNPDHRIPWWYENIALHTWRTRSDTLSVFGKDTSYNKVQQVSAILLVVTACLVLYDRGGSHA